MRRFETQEAARKQERGVLDGQSTSLGYDDIMRQNVFKKKKKKDMQRIKCLMTQNTERSQVEDWVWVGGP